MFGATLAAVMAMQTITELQAEQARQEKRNDPGDSMAIEGEVTGRWYEGQSEARERITGEHGDSERPGQVVVLLPTLP